MNRYADPCEFSALPDDEEYNAYLDGLSVERLRQIDDDLSRMWEADQKRSDALRNFLDAAEQAIENIGRALDN